MHEFICSHHLCQKKFTIKKNGKCLEDYKKKQFHFCSTLCQSHAQKKDGVLYKKRQEDNLEKLGVKHHMQTNITQENFKQSMLKSYGVTHPSQSEEIKGKKKQSCIEKYGVDNPMKSNVIKQKTQQTNLSRYNSITPLTCKEIQVKSKKTLIEKYGADNFYKTSHFKSFMSENIDSIIKKRNNTLKRNNSYGKSRPEEQCFLTLINLFGEENVDRQVVPKAHRCPIDFYISCRDLYIQVDGIYWHRLNTTLESLQQKNDNFGIKKVLADRKQNQWFSENNLKLIRITEYEAVLPPEILTKILDQKLESKIHHTP